jgi:hypothetical protein
MNHHLHRHGLHYCSRAWPGGFVLDSPVYTGCVAAADGTVVAGTERVYRMRPGAARLQWADLPDAVGEAVCFAVEPRRRGRPARFAVAYSRNVLHIHDGDDVAVREFDRDGSEICEMMWAPNAFASARARCLYLLFNDYRLLLLSESMDGAAPDRLEQVVEPAGAVITMATDGTTVALASFDKESWDLDVWVLADPTTGMWQRRSIRAPSFFAGARLALAGSAVAVSFPHGGIWITRDLERNDFVELEELRGLDPETDGAGGGPIVFEGASADAALFASVQDSTSSFSIVRVDAAGRVERIAELRADEHDSEKPPLIREMAWDATRRTLWAAVGRGGVLRATAPGAPGTDASWVPPS